jgi:hypothetical protein
MVLGRPTGGSFRMHRLHIHITAARLLAALSITAVAAVGVPDAFASSPWPVAGHTRVGDQRPAKARLSAGAEKFSGAVSGDTLHVTTLDDGLSALDMAKVLVGNGVSVSNASFIGAWPAGGTFSGGTSIIGFESGVVLSTGRAGDVIGPNVSDSWSTNSGMPGDDSLTDLIGYPTYDAAALSFDFVPDSDHVYFEYVFSSEEYNEFVNREYDDVFAFFVNGVNRAAVGSPSVPVSVNTINNGDPYGSDPRSHPELFTTNSQADGMANLDTEMDGLTTVLVCDAPVVKGASNHITLVIGDVSDGVYDSNVFIRASSLSSKAPSTFAPKPDGWQLENSSDKNPSGDWLVWSHLFGSSERSLAKYEAQVESDKQLGHAGIFDGGNCYGFAASAASYFTEDRSLVSTGLGVSHPWDFGPGSKGYPSDGLLNGSMNPAALWEIEEFQLAQFENLANQTEQANAISEDHGWGWWNSGQFKDALRGWLDRLQSALKLEPQIITLKSVKPKVVGSGGGHGVVAYRMSIEQGGDLIKVFIYDDNWPGDTTRFIAFWPNVPKWQYELFKGETWGSADRGDAISFFRAFWPAWAVNSTAPVHYMDTKWSVSNARAVTFTDAAGDSSGFSTQGDTWQIPGLIPWVRTDLTRGEHAAPSIDYVVPAAADVSMAVTPDASGAYVATVPGTDSDAYISAAWPAANVNNGAADSIRVSSGGDQVSIVPGSAAAARIVLASDWGLPCMACDVAFTPGGSPATGISLSATRMDGGIAIDVADQRGLIRPLSLGWLGGSGSPVTVPKDGLVRMEVTGGAAAGQMGQPSELTVRTDVDADGTWDSVSTSVVSAVPLKPHVAFRVVGPRTYAAQSRGLRRRPLALRYRGTTTSGDGLTTVRILVRNKLGRLVKRIRLGKKASGRWYSTKWTPAARGTFRYYVYANDSLGIAQERVGSGRVIVR